MRKICFEINGKPSSQLELKLKMRKGNNVAACGMARKMAAAIWYALNGFLPDAADDENALRKKSGTIFTELKLSVVQELDCKSR